MSRVVLVTGGVNGIGLATVKKFLSKGDKVVIASLYFGQSTDETVEELKKEGEVLFVPCNVAKLEDCQNVVKAAMEHFGRIDVLANVAGITGERKGFLDVDLNDVARVIDVNLMGTIYMSHAVAQEMAKQKKGVIIHVGSLCGFLANSEAIGYHASKGGIRMATEAMAKDLSQYGIRVLSVAPGWVNTSLMDQKVMDYGGTMHLKGRIIEPEEIANVIYLMSLDEASAINGTTVMADDGYTAFKGVKMRTVIR